MNCCKCKCVADDEVEVINEAMFSACPGESWNHVQLWLPNSNATPFPYKWVVPPVERHENRYGILDVDGVAYTVTETSIADRNGDIDIDHGGVSVRRTKIGGIMDANAIWHATIGVQSYVVCVPKEAKDSRQWAARFVATIRKAVLEFPNMGKPMSPRRPAKNAKKTKVKK